MQLKKLENKGKGAAVLILLAFTHATTHFGWTVIFAPLGHARDVLLTPHGLARESLGGSWDRGGGSGSSRGSWHGGRRGRCHRSIRCYAHICACAELLLGSEP